jgi:hypothetical protein
VSLPQAGTIKCPLLYWSAILHECLAAGLSALFVVWGEVCLFGDICVEKRKMVGKKKSKEVLGVVELSLSLYVFGRNANWTYTTNT